LVKDKVTGELAVAKKIQLEGLKKAEIESSHQEAKMLKELKHPNIGIS
jgi:hypothetical protein